MCVQVSDFMLLIFPAPDFILLNVGVSTLLSAEWGDNSELPQFYHSLFNIAGLENMF